MKVITTDSKGEETTMHKLDLSDEEEETLSLPDKLGPTTPSSLLIKRNQTREGIRYEQPVVRKP